MTITTHAFAGPIPASAANELPALQFYGIYAQAFNEHFETTSSDLFYAASCKMYKTDRTIMTDGAQMWTLFKGLYSTFPKVTREFLTCIVVSDDEAGTHRIHSELVTTLFLDSEGHRKVEVPQAFVYTLGEADEGKGTLGLQFTELRNYYDMSLVEKAKADVGS